MFNDVDDDGEPCLTTSTCTTLDLVADLTIPNDKTLPSQVNEGTRDTRAALQLVKSPPAPAPIANPFAQHHQNATPASGKPFVQQKQLGQDKQHQQQQKQQHGQQQHREEEEDGLGGNDLDQALLSQIDGMLAGALNEGACTQAQGPDDPDPNTGKL